MLRRLRALTILIVIIGLFLVFVGQRLLPATEPETETVGVLPTGHSDVDDPVCRLRCIGTQVSRDGRGEIRRWGPFQDLYRHPMRDLRANCRVFV